jgi:hypothetical protein
MRRANNSSIQGLKSVGWNALLCQQELFSRFLFDGAWTSDAASSREAAKEGVCFLLRFLEDGSLLALPT